MPSCGVYCVWRATADHVLTPHFRSDVSYFVDGGLEGMSRVRGCHVLTGQSCWTDSCGVTWTTLHAAVSYPTLQHWGATFLLWRCCRRHRHAWTHVARCWMTFPPPEVPTWKYWKLIVSIAGISVQLFKFILMWLSFVMGQEFVCCYLLKTLIIL
jgi:hypothetical protein